MPVNYFKKKYHNHST